MSIARERFQVIDGVAGVHEAASREDRSMRFLVRRPSRILTVVPRGVAFRVISR